MTERRALDRRQQDAPVATERRHGERRTYQAGCSCTPCKAAEAAYRADLRKRHLKGLPILGALVSAVETRRQLRLLITEYETEDALAQRFGLHDPRVRVGRHVVRVATALKVQRRYQLDILAGLDHPGALISPSV